MERSDTPIVFSAPTLSLERESICIDRDLVRRLIKDCIVTPAKTRYDLGETNQMVACSNRKALGPNDLTLREWDTLCERLGLEFENELRDVVKEVYGGAFDIICNFHQASIPVYSTTVISVVGPALSVHEGTRLKQVLGILCFE